MVINVRKHLSQSTYAAHEALHSHPLFSRLLNPDLRTSEYVACLAVSLTFFEAIEDACLAQHLQQEFSLSSSIRALRADLRKSEKSEIYGQSWKSPSQQDELLGALYVAHGSQFGRQVIGEAVAHSLPSVDQRYFAMKSDPDTWRALLTQIENYGQDPTRCSGIEAGARSAFAIFTKLADDSFSALMPARL